MGHIDWMPIAKMPDALKDGREILLWETVNGYGAEFASWDAAQKCGPLSVKQNDGVWCDRDGATIHGITHFAELNPPT